MEWIQLLTVLMSIVGSAFTFFVIIRNDIRYMEEKWEKNIQKMEDRMQRMEEKWERLFSLFVANMKK